MKTFESSPVIIMFWILLMCKLFFSTNQSAPNQLDWNLILSNSVIHTQYFLLSEKGVPTSNLLATYDVVVVVFTFKIEIERKLGRIYTGGFIRQPAIVHLREISSRINVWNSHQLMQADIFLFYDRMYYN